jgi:FeS assembly SUF system protein
MTTQAVYPLALEAEIIEAICTVYDPEIPVNIYEMGLIYEIAVDDTGDVDVTMTLTSPACPVAGSLPGEVEMTVRAVPGVTDVRVHLTWEPPWTMDRMSEEAKLELGFL